MPQQVTLLQLIQTVATIAVTEAELFAAVEHLVNSGQVELVGTFRGCRIAVDVAPACVA